MKRLRATWAALGLVCACEAGPRIFLGTVPDGGRASDGSAFDDADAEQDERDGDDDEREAGVMDGTIPCNDWDDCDGTGLPYCSDELDRCVECLWDDHCPSGEECRDRRGVCVND